MKFVIDDDLGKAHYTKRIPKPGGGYRYIYDDKKRNKNSSSNRDKDAYYALPDDINRRAQNEPEVLAIQKEISTPPFSPEKMNKLHDNLYTKTVEVGKAIQDNEKKLREATDRYHSIKDKLEPEDKADARQAALNQVSDKSSLTFQAPLNKPMPLKALKAKALYMSTFVNEMEKRMKKGMSLTIDLEKGGPYIGPRGGKYADPQHKIPWGGNSKGKAKEAYFQHVVRGAEARLRNSENRHNATMGKVLWHKDSDEIEAKIDKHPKVKEALDNWKKEKAGVHGSLSTDEAKADNMQRKADYLDIYDTIAELYLKDAGKEKTTKLNYPDGSKMGKSMSNNGAMNELVDFVKSTIEDDSQPTINESKKNGEGQSLAGKGKTSGSIPSDGGAPIGAPKSKVEKLSEDDEVDEKNMKPHKKPIENARKSLPVYQQNEQMARERAIWLSHIQASKDVSPQLAAPLQKAEEVKPLTADEMAANLVKSDTFYHGENPRILKGSPLSTPATCSNCGGGFMKALTVCPHCGKDNS